jgi:hypothetical protein
MKIRLLEYDTEALNGIPEKVNVWFGVVQVYQDSMGDIVLRDMFGADRTIFAMNSRKVLQIEKED